MEKINKEELMKRLNLSEEEMEKITGGSSIALNSKCLYRCSDKYSISKHNEELDCIERCMEQYR